MTDDFVQIIALVGAVGIALLFLLEVRRWRDLSVVLGRKQRIIRTVLILLIEVMFALVFVGPLVTGHKNIMGELIYWLVCMVIGLAVVILALLDVLGVTRNYIALHREMFKDLKGKDRREK